MATLIFQIIGVLAGGEILIHLLFLMVSKMIGKSNHKDKIGIASVLKGMVERTFVVISCYFGLASALTLLGALKIATRIKDKEDKVSNDFFLMGNLVSVLFGIIYYIILKHLIGEA